MPMGSTCFPATAFKQLNVWTQGSDTEQPTRWQLRRSVTLTIAAFVGGLFVDRAGGRPTSFLGRSISRVFTPQSRRVQSRPQFVAERIPPIVREILWLLR